MFTICDYDTIHFDLSRRHSGWAEYIRYMTFSNLEGMEAIFENDLKHAFYISSGHLLLNLDYNPIDHIASRLRHQDIITTIRTGMFTLVHAVIDDQHVHGYHGYLIPSMLVIYHGESS